MTPLERPRLSRPTGWLAAALCAGVGAFLLPEVAWASGGAHEEGGSSTLVVVALLGAVAVAYMLAHLVVDALQKRFLVLAGVEYILLGILLGEQMPHEIPAFSNLSDPHGQGHGLLPIVALAVGWVGLLRGMELSVRSHRQAPRTGALRVVAVQGIVAGGVTTLAAYAAFSQGWLFPFSSAPAQAVAAGGEVLRQAADIVMPSEAWMAAGVMGCAAAAGSFEPIELLKRRYRLEGELADRIRRIAALSDLLAIVVFGLLFCVFHKGSVSAQVELSATEWAVVTLLLGALLGILFTPFLGDDDSENGRFLAMAGIIVLASGAAYFLDLSPLLVNLCLGAVLVNTAKNGAQIRATLERTKRPMALVLLVFAGALARPVDPAEATLVSSGYIVLRLIGKAIGTNLACYRSAQRGDYYRGLLAHGEVSVAMAVSLRLVYSGAAIDLAYTAILASVVVNDLIAPRVLRGLLVDTGDLRGERKEEPA